MAYGLFSSVFKTLTQRNQFRMDYFMIILCVIPSLTSITISSNGNSPEIKLIGGMLIDVQKGFIPMAIQPEATTVKTNRETSTIINNNSTKLAINERYRRLIPYMTFYYANDLVTPTTEAYTAKKLNIEVEKLELVEASALEQSNQRQPKKIVYSTRRNIPRYKGNRLTQFNIASANPTNIYKEMSPHLQNNQKVTPNHNVFLSDYHNIPNNNYGRFIYKHIDKVPSAPFAPTRKPFLPTYHNINKPNVRYFLSEKEFVPKFQLVPYEQTPPVHVLQNDNSYDTAKKPIPVPVLIPKEQEFNKSRPRQPIYYFDNFNNAQTAVRKQPQTISESYYEKQLPRSEIIQPVIEGGFKPIISPLTTEASVYTTPVQETPLPSFENEKQNEQIIETVPIAPAIDDYKSQPYYQYVVKQPTFKPEEYVAPKPINLGDLLSSLQLNKSIPRPITNENVGSSIQTLLQVLNILKAAPQQNEIEVPVLSTPKPFEPSKLVTKATPKPVIEVIEATPKPANIELNEERYLAPVRTPSQHLDYSTTQQFPLPVTSDDEGGTPGRPGVDYPILTTIPQTRFDCKSQRYKGFFADPETKCQVWHYCDLNGGQASFLCPNGTIFSQAALTCDWWFNVRCASTTQLYVLNESLYKYILPHSPKFPEDYSGPLVDKYLTLKFKEMEEQFRKNKNKQSASEKIDSNEEATEASDEKDDNFKEKENNDKNITSVSEASVAVMSFGVSGNVERLPE